MSYLWSFKRSRLKAQACSTQDTPCLGLQKNSWNYLNSKLEVDNEIVDDPEEFDEDAQDETMYELDDV